MAYFWRSFLLPPSSWFGLEMSQEMDASQQLQNERENQLKHMLELLRINASTHVIDIENVSAGKDFII